MPYSISMEANKGQAQFNQLRLLKREATEAACLTPDPADFKTVRWFLFFDII